MRLERVGWDEFFKVFDESDVAFLHGEGDSRFNKFVAEGVGREAELRGKRKGRPRVARAPFASTRALARNYLVLLSSCCRREFLTASALLSAEFLTAAAWFLASAFICVAPRLTAFAVRLSAALSALAVMLSAMLSALASIWSALFSAGVCLLQAASAARPAAMTRVLVSFIDFPLCSVSEIRSCC